MVENGKIGSVEAEVVNKGKEEVVEMNEEVREIKGVMNHVS